LNVSTTQPGLQFYSGNFRRLHQGKSGRSPYAAFWFLFRDTAFLRIRRTSRYFRRLSWWPGSEYRAKTVFAFSVQLRTTPPPTASQRRGVKQGDTGNEAVPCRSPVHIARYAGL
jgi:hypothetical protein